MKPARDTRRRLVLTRIIGIIAIAFGLNYIIWRYSYSLNPKALWFSIPMVLAETYGIIDMILFVIMSWRRPARMPPPLPLEHATVDVFITTYNEAEDLVRLTAEAALRIDWPYKKVYILDDGSRPQMKALADALGCGYISRGKEWENKPRHAKAGNVNNALLETDGDFILVLDADQIPAPDILKKTLGFFRDEKMAFVQTPQYFYNLPPGDPFGNEASLFYGPIQQGKDGWNAAFFCGSNAVLRREALMQLGIQEYVSSVEKRMKETIANLSLRVKKIRTNDLETEEAMRELRHALMESKSMLKSHIPLEAIIDHIVNALQKAERLLARKDLGEIAQALQDLAQIGDTKAADVSKFVARNLDRITQKVPSTAIGDFDISEEEAHAVVVSRSDEAIPIQALSTISITEDMATAMSLHAMGWKSVFYPEVLAYGLAPEDFRSSLKQRLRWAQGTVQVFVRKNPFLQKGLSLPQKLMYFATMYSYFSGIFNLILILAPAVYFFTGIAPVASWSWEFFYRFIPFFIMNKIMFRFVAAGIPVRRGEQYNLAMFPLNISAVWSVLSGRKLSFVVTPKKREESKDLRLIRWQLAAMIILAVGMISGILRWATGAGVDFVGLAVNLIWSIYNINELRVVLKALYYKYPEGWNPQLPESMRGIST